MDVDRRRELLQTNSEHFVDWLELRELKQSMSNGDFEVMPLGTMVEVRELRKLTKELIDLEYQYGINTPQPVRQKILEIQKFYNWHVETYPVIV